MRHRYKVLSSSNYDGDTFSLTLDLGFDLVTHQRIRLDGIDTPELRGGTEQSKLAGRLARDEARAFIEDGLASGARVEFVSMQYKGKFGRPLGDLEVDGVSLVGMLAKRRLGVPYSGQAKAQIADQHLANIQYLTEQGLIS